MNRDIIKELKNAEGKRLNTKIKLEYAKAISDELKKNPESLSKLIENLDITEEELFLYLAGEKLANITLYDQALSHLVKTLRKGNPTNAKG